MWWGTAATWSPSRRQWYCYEREGGEREGGEREGGREGGRGIGVSGVLGACLQCNIILGTHSETHPLATRWSNTCGTEGL